MIPLMKKVKDATLISKNDNIKKLLPDFLGAPLLDKNIKRRRVR